MELMVVIDTEHFETQREYDRASGHISEERFRAAERAKEMGIAFTPMTDSLRRLQVYEKKGKGNEGNKPVFLGDLGPYCLVRLSNTGVVNQFSPVNLNKPIRVDWTTLVELHAIFHKGESKIDAGILPSQGEAKTMAKAK